MKILIIKPSSLGDVIHALRVVYQIKENSRFVQIDWVIKSELQPILSASGFVKKVYLFERGAGFINFIKLIKAIRKKKYDYALDLQGLLRSACLLKFALSKYKLGVADGREFSTLFYKSVGEKSRELEIHALDRLIPFLANLGIQDYNRNLSIDFPKSNVSGVTQKILGEKKFILLFPESRRKEKVWPFFRELTESLSKISSLNLVVSGNIPDRQFIHAIDLRGKVGLDELPELINRSQLVVTNDSAPLHIASALGKPLVALFGPTSMKSYGPYPTNFEKSSVISARDGKIDSITVSEVELMIEKLLG